MGRSEARLEWVWRHSLFCDGSLKPILWLLRQVAGHGDGRLVRDDRCSSRSVDTPRIWQRFQWRAGPVREGGPSPSLCNSRRRRVCIFVVY